MVYSWPLIFKSSEGLRVCANLLVWIVVDRVPWTSEADRLCDGRILKLKVRCGQVQIMSP